MKNPKRIVRNFVTVVAVFAMVFSMVNSIFASVIFETNDTVILPEYNFKIYTASTFNKKPTSDGGITGQIAVGTLFSEFYAGKKFLYEVQPTDPCKTPARNYVEKEYAPYRIGHSKVYLYGYVESIEEHWQRINGKWVHKWVVTIGGSGQKLLFTHDKNGYTMQELYYPYNWRNVK